jgi:hypothetical protein
MADPNDGKLWKDDKLWEIRSKGFNYLLVAHAAGLIACLTVLKDYDPNPALKRLGSFIWIFGFGLMGAILGVVVLITARQGELVHGRNMHTWERRLVVFSSLGSTALLFAALIVAICKFGRL